MVVVETFIKDSKEPIPEACKEDGSTSNQGRYATTSKVFLRPGYISNSKEENVNMGGGSDSIQISDSKCIPVVDCSLQKTRTSVHDEVLCN